MDVVVSAGDLGAVSIRDYGGTGYPVVLVHGAGADRTGWDGVGSLLAARHRTVAVDQPDHGRTTGAPWSWETAVDTIEAAVSALGWQRPAVVGHSVGGLVAGRWAQRHPECPCAVSLDGHRVTAVHAEHHDGAAAGLDVEQLSAMMGRYRRWFDALFAEHERTLCPTQLRGSLAARTAMSDDDFTSLRGVHVPLLMVVAERSGPGTPAEFEPLLAAFRAGLSRDLASLTAEQPTMTVRSIDAHHGMIAASPHEVAGLVDDFIAAAVRADTGGDDHPDAQS